MSIPDPTDPNPLTEENARYRVFVRPTITSEKIEVGEYTYYDASAIIGAMAVVTRDIAPYTVVGGNPAQLIKHRYPAAEVEPPRRAAWWDWPIEVITDHAATLMAATPADIAEIAATLTPTGGMGP